MDERWTKIEEFPQYSVSTFGNIRNDERGRLVQPSVTKQGALKVGLVLGGKQYTRSVKVIVANAFVPGRTERFNTPMQLDGNQYNVHAGNIVWRPRWFTWKYQRQFERVGEWVNRGPIIDASTGKIYVDIYDVAITNGFLFVDIERSLDYNEEVYPGGYQFNWYNVKISEK